MPAGGIQNIFAQAAANDKGFQSPNGDYTSAPPAGAGFGADINFLQEYAANQGSSTPPPASGNTLNLTTNVPSSPEAASAGIGGGGGSGAAAPSSVTPSASATGNIGTPSSSIGTPLTGASSASGISGSPSTSAAGSTPSAGSGSLTWPSVLSYLQANHGYLFERENPNLSL